MKKIYLRNALTFLVFLTLSSVYAQSNVITLKALPGGSEGTTVFSDSSVLNVSAAGVVTYSNSTTTDDWGVTASTVTQSGALNKTFSVLMGGISSVNTTAGGSFGQKLTDGGVDRASDGLLGIRGSTGGGIDLNEGFNFGLDLLTLGSTAGIQITKIGVKFAGAVNERGVIVNRGATSKQIVFGKSGTPGVTHPVTDADTDIDVTSLNLFVTGGKSVADLVAIFNNSLVDNSFRVTKIEMKVLTNNLNMEEITNVSHPRLFLKAGEEAQILSLINSSPEHKKSHDYIIKTADEFLTAPTIVKPANAIRVLAEARKAVEEIFYLSYAFRMTGQTKYLTQGEKVINDVCNWDNWITYSLDTSEMTFAVALGYDWLFNNLSATTKQKAREKILNYGFLTQKTKPFWDYTSNWNQVCIGALSCSAIAIYGDGTTQMDTEASYIMNRILVKNPNSMNTYNDGNYPEGPMYWSYGTTYEVVMLSALEGIYGQNHEGINRLIASPGFLESAEFMQYVTGPTSYYFNYSDSTAERIPLPATLWMAKKANKPEWLTEEKKLMQNGTYASNIGSRGFLPMALIFGKDISLDNLTNPQKKLWTGNGVNPVALVRTEWQGSLGKYMGVKGGTPTYSHGQMDGGFFVYDSQGVRWGMDFGKYDYDAQGTLDDGDNSQFGDRWKIFRVACTSQNTISIKKSTETTWQNHKVDGNATIDELYDTNAKRGAKVNMKSLLGLNNELLAANRSAYLVDESYFEVKDFISNGASDINLYWNMVTRSTVELISPSKLRLTYGGKRVILEVVSSNPAATFTMATNRSTDPVDYNPAATADSKNPGTVMIGFEATIPANNEVTFTVTIKDDTSLAPSTVELINNIVLDIPNPNTGREGSTLFFDASELHVDANGAASIGGNYEEYAWVVNGSTDISAADNTKFFFGWGGMGTTDTTPGANYGAKLTQAGIDRANDGKIGVRGGAGGGIDANEGFSLGFDASYLPPTLQLQIVKIRVDAVLGARMGEIVNRKDTTKKISFGGSSSTATIKLPSGAADLNVESLGLVVKGGTTDYDIASLFNTGTVASGGFRMIKFVLKIVDISTTVWNGANWSYGSPGPSINAVIEGNYSTATNGSFNAKKLTINSGSLTTNTNIEIQNEIINNAGVTGIVIQNNGSITQVNPLAVNTGNITVHKDSNLLKRLDYTLWSSPVVGSQTLANFSPLTSQSPNRFYIYDKTLGTEGLFAPIAPTTSFSKGIGYLIRMPNENPAILGTSSAYYLGTASIIYTGIFTGVPNNGTISLNSLTPNTFYAIGNPYPSTISADAFINGNATAGTLYFWRKTNAAAGTAYATYTLLGGAGTNTGNSGLGNPNGTIAIGQGFIVKTGLATTTLNFTNTMRTSGTGSTQFFKTKKLAVKDRVWLNLSNAGGIINQTLIGYMDGATQGVDAGIDGKYINDSAIALTSTINNEEYTIQGRPAFEATDVVALNFKTDVAGDYSIALDYFDGVFTSEQAVYLIDSKTGAETNLKASAYNFKAEAGADNARFSLKYQKTLKIIDSELNENSVTVYRNNGSLFVKSEASTISNIKVFDIQGRLIAEQKRVNSNTASIDNLKTNQALIVQVSTDDKKIVNKKVLN
jgi:Heparinase II/III-like protein